MNRTLNTVVAVAAIAALVGAVFGAGVMRSVKNGEIAALKLDHAEKMTRGYQVAMEVTNGLRTEVVRVRNQPVRRVRCESTSAAPAVPAGDAGSAVGDLRSVGAGRDYGPALRELLAGAAQVNAIAERQTGHMLFGGGEGGRE